MVTARDPVARLPLPAVEDLVFAGHDVRTESLMETARAASEAGGVPDRATLSVVREDLEVIDDRVTIGTARRCGDVVEGLSTDRPVDDSALTDVVARIRDDYASFVEDAGLDRLVVVNVASTEPPL